LARGQAPLRSADANDWRGANLAPAILLAKPRPLWNTPANNTPLGSLFRNEGERDD